ncbi:MULTISPECIES: energy transducer TonB [unclassified Sphingobacterium]|uniref:energy transducer TonB n=1 Tax=unclassified Sphingobacterium TaxID=2609468 RepID=UPI0014046957|nr:MULTISPECIES: energy transducer TonB [unclassified Sphingobacterium]MCS3552583.1 hypothetical protein [Sphingobacterium sp. JUb21]
MIKFIFSIIIALSMISSCSPISLNKKESAADVVDQHPLPPKGMDEFMRYIGDNFHYSKEMIDNQISGIIEIAFIIEKDGSISDCTILRNLGYGTGEEGVRVLKNAGKWTPAYKDKKAVRMAYVLPIRLNTKNNFEVPLINKPIKAIYDMPLSWKKEEIIGLLNQKKIAAHDQGHTVFVPDYTFKSLRAKFFRISATDEEKVDEYVLLYKFSNDGKDEIISNYNRFLQEMILLYGEPSLIKFRKIDQDTDLNQLEANPVIWNCTNAVISIAFDKNANELLTTIKNKD